MRNLARNIWHLPRKTISWIVTGYQHTLSPDHGPLKDLYSYGYCRHHPTCSEYCKKTVIQSGVMIGVPLTIWRVLRCNPWRKPDEKVLKNAVKKHLNMP